MLDKDGVLVARNVYSGFGEGKNNPAMESVHDVGPIPEGLWKISGPPQDTETHGPYVLALYPQKGTETYGRSGFLIHGDSIAAPGTASHGCIICDRRTRSAIWQSADYDLTVVP